MLSIFNIVLNEFRSMFGKYIIINLLVLHFKLLIIFIFTMNSPLNSSRQSSHHTPSKHPDTPGNESFTSAHDV
jgi:hypothetical protein